MEKIDFVVTWVDNSDAKWLAVRNEYSPANKKMNDENRYREYGFLKYWFRAVEKYAPWVNKVFLVTSGHLPKWIDTNHEKLVHIKHEDYIPTEYLPTFNSNVIELNLHRIPELSNHFVLFNDDLFLNSPTKPNDFFYKGLPKDFGIYSFCIPWLEFSSIEFNNVKTINKHFPNRRDMWENWNKYFNLGYGLTQFRTLLTFPWPHVTGYFNAHLTTSILKKNMFILWEKESELLDQVSKHKFREITDVNQWLISHWQVESNEFYPQKKKFGKLRYIDNYEPIINDLKKEKYKVLCINDQTDMNIDTEKAAEVILKEFEAKFPEKSSYEL